MLEFGDVIYRPCLSYAGKKNFVNTQIVLETIVKDGKDYIRSIDFVGQKWTDSLNDLGGTIFVDKDKARTKLYRMIADKETKKEKRTRMTNRFEVLDKFRDELMDKFMSLCNYNDYNKINLLTIGETVDRIYDKCIDDMVTEDEM